VTNLSTSWAFHSPTMFADFVDAVDALAQNSLSSQPFFGKCAKASRRSWRYACPDAREILGACAAVPRHPGSTTIVGGG